MLNAIVGLNGSEGKRRLKSEQEKGALSHLANHCPLPTMDGSEDVIVVIF